ncbi:MAG: DUF167 domain-containing protein [Phycisphaerae bacterium]|nr:DUF167 domain-containing protein [Phycisphaerae bacterium]
MAGVEIKQVGDRILFTVKVVPASSRTAMAGEMEGMLKVKVQAPPEKGKANDCLLAFLAGKLGVRKNAVEITSGMSHPVKQIAVQGLTVAGAKEKLSCI